MGGWEGGRVGGWGWGGGGGGGGKEKRDGESRVSEQGS